MCCVLCIHVYIIIQCIYVHKREEAQIQKYYVQRGGDIGKGTKGRVEVNNWNFLFYLSELFHYIIFFFNSRGGGTTSILPPTSGSNNFNGEGVYYMVGTVR